MDSNVMSKLLMEENYTSPLNSENNSTFLVYFTIASSTLGITLSASALLLLIFTAVLFKEWRRNYKNQLLIQFMFARFLYTLRRYLSSKLYYSQNVFCVKIEAFTMIYTELLLVFWMFVFSKQMYDCFVRVFKVPNTNLCIVTLSTWIIPGLITLLIYFTSCLKSDIYYRDILVCLFFIKWPVLVANGVLLVLILNSILKNNLSNTESNTRIIIVISVLIFTFCIQQMIVDIYRLIYKESTADFVIVLLNILSMYHCAFSIMFWVLGNAKTREMWKFSKSPK